MGVCLHLGTCPLPLASARIRRECKYPYPGMHPAARRYDTRLSSARKEKEKLAGIGLVPPQLQAERADLLTQKQREEAALPSAPSPPPPPVAWPVAELGDSRTGKPLGLGPTRLALLLPVMFDFDLSRRSQDIGVRIGTSQQAAPPYALLSGDIRQMRVLSLSAASFVAPRAR